RLSCVTFTASTTWVWRTRPLGVNRVVVTSYLVGMARFYVGPIQTETLPNPDTQHDKKTHSPRREAIELALIRTSESRRPVASISWNHARDVRRTIAGPSGGPTASHRRSHRQNARLGPQKPQVDGRGAGRTRTSDRRIMRP